VAADGERIGGLVLLRDVSAERAAERAKDDLMAAVSHELRTPLAALQATGEVLAGHREELSPAAREAADLVVEDVVDLRRLIEDLLEVSELDSRRATVRYEPVDLQSLAQAVVKRRRAEVPVEGPHVVTAADKARTERILGNLVDNALQHAGGEGVRVAVSSSNGTCEVAVRDRGPGIAPGDLPHLFERFYKADRSRSRARGGIGLGLAIAMQNARLMGGTIVVSSEEGAGSTFTLQLPLRSSYDGDA
jgi:two-component system sensor histidine kinase MtrB